MESVGVVEENRMAFLGWAKWLLFGCALVAVVTGCGSTSTGDSPPDRAAASAPTSPGPAEEVYKSQVLVRESDGGAYRWIPMAVVCQPEGDCEMVAPDGESYRDLQAFADNSELIRPGDEVVGSANMTRPGEPVQVKTFTRRAVAPWIWYAGGGALLVLVVAIAVWRLATRGRRHRRGDERRLHAWEEPWDSD